MGDWAPAVGIIGLTLIIGTTVVLRGPMGKALAEWIRGWSKTDERWRLDFTERLLAKERQAERLVPPR
jgi:hypothetical protein